MYFVRSAHASGYMALREGVPARKACIQKYTHWKIHASNSDVKMIELFSLPFYPYVFNNPQTPCPVAKFICEYLKGDVKDQHNLKIFLDNNVEAFSLHCFF